MNILIDNLFCRYVVRLTAYFFAFVFMATLSAQDITPSQPGRIALSVETAKRQGKDFKQIDLFRENNRLVEREQFEGVLAQASYVTMVKAALEDLVKERPEAISLSVPYFGQSLDMDLVKVDVLSGDFRTYTSDSGNKPVPYEPGVYYRGVIKGDSRSVVALSFFADEVIGMASSNERGNISFNRVDKSDDYLLYSDKDLLVTNPTFCSTEEPENYAQEVQEYLNNYIETRDVKCVKVYIECDYALYQNKGSVSNVNNWISAVYNNVAALYANEQITTQISTTYVWTSADPYSKTSSSTALTQFRNNRPSFNGDLAHLAALGGNNIGGVAWLDVLCSNYNYAYSNIQSSYQNVPTYSWTVEVMTHEMGHNLGSPHTQSCSWVGGALDNCYTTEGGCPPGPPPTNGGTIMSYCHLTSYGINFNNGFGTQPGDLIRSKVNAANCLGTCSGGGSSCTVPSGLAVSNIGNTTATVSWAAVSGASAYQLRIRVAGGSWTELAQQSGTSVNLTGLAAGTSYEVQVRTICSDGNSDYSPTVSFVTTGGGGSSCGVPTGLTVADITQTTATVSWNAVNGAVSYTLRYKLSSSGSWYTYTTTSTIVNFSGMTAGTSYDVGVRTDCSDQSSDYSATVTFTTSGGGASYCTSQGNNSSYEWIDKVKLGSINNITSSNNGYGDFTSLNTNLNAGSTYTLTLSAGMNGTYREYWTVWIDYNQDGDFLDSGERVTRFSSTRVNDINRSFKVPTTAKNGATRMRVQMKYGAYSSSCETFSYGEVEDYTVTINGGSSLPQSLTMTMTDFTIFPNPGENDFMVQFEAGGSFEARIYVLDANGKQVLSQMCTTVPGNNVIPVSTAASLNPGMYIVRIVNQNTEQSVKWIKIQ
ncbi:MAG: fibronectin type III domain-containing protein [Saprospiraceae bacterium]|nr:fibronectin type III domain-containing protein [Saprospiraceae bacterium]